MSEIIMDPETGDTTAYIHYSIFYKDLWVAQ